MSPAFVPSTAAEDKTPERKRVERLMDRDQTKAAFAAIDAMMPQVLDEQLTIVKIPAPVGQEAARARWFFDRFREAGLADVHIDDAGNVLGRRPGRGAPPVILSAHLDTVFEDQAIEVRRDGTVLRAPGIGDDARGLASLLALLRALNAAKVQTEADLWIVATAGEEGLGDLKGSKHLYREGGIGPTAAAFLTLDVSGEDRIVHRGLGSMRLRVVLRGPGGHSWANFGRPNPIQALGRAMACLAAEPASKAIDARSSYNFGRIGGGTSVNSVPQEAWVEVDLRSESSDELRRLELRLDGCVRNAIEAERAWAKPDAPRLEPAFEVVGQRPSGALPESSPVLRLALEASRQLGIEPKLEVMSTDANVPLSQGRPALALGYGGTGGDAHSQSEWYDPTGSERALKRNLLLLLALLGSAD